MCYIIAMEERKIKITTPSHNSTHFDGVKYKVDLPPSHFVKDEMQNRRLIVDGITDSYKIIVYDGKDDGSQIIWLLHNRLCNNMDNHNQISLPNRFWQPWLVCDIWPWFHWSKYLVKLVHTCWSFSQLPTAMKHFKGKLTLVTALNRTQSKICSFVWEICSPMINIIKFSLGRNTRVCEQSAEWWWDCAKVW